MSKITGYRELTEQEIDMINSIKDFGSELQDYFDGLETVDSVDKRWLAIAKTDLQKGLMALVRSVAKPTTF